MAANGLATHEHWQSRFGFLMAAMGFAIGLGNIWRFPYMTGEMGGAAFVFVYVICAFGVGVPILMAELMIGRRGGMSPPGSMKAVAVAEGQSARWQWVGNMNLLAAFIIQVVYCVITGWVLFYLYKAVVTGFSGVEPASAVTEFDALMASTGIMLFWTWLGLLIVGLVVYAGVQNGIEKASRWMMPMLFALLVGLVIYNMFGTGFDQALRYLFTPDFSKITGAVWLAAVGQAFFSIGVAMAGMMTFGAYLPKHISIARSVWVIIIADTSAALLAGLVIFPAVFANGLDPQGGPGLIFHTLPVAFAQMPGGHLFSVLFFLLVAVAAITSMVGLVEALTAWLEEHKGYARHRSAVVMLVVIGLLSTFSMLSYNELSEWRFSGKNLNETLDYFSNQVLLPLGGILIAVFAGWCVKRDSARDELALGNDALFNLWRCLIRYPVPVAVSLMFIAGVSS